MLDPFEGGVAYRVDNLAVVDGGEMVVSAGSLVKVSVASSQEIDVQSGATLRAAGSGDDPAMVQIKCDDSVLVTDSDCSTYTTTPIRVRSGAVMDLDHAQLRSIQVVATGGEVTVRDSEFRTGTTVLTDLDDLSVTESTFVQYPLVANDIDRPVLSGNTWLDTDAPVALNDIDDLSGIEPDNVLAGSGPLQRSMTISSSRVPSQSTWTLGSSDKLIHVLNSVSVQGGGTMVANDVAVRVNGALPISGTLNASRTTFGPASTFWTGIHALDGSTVRISASQFSGTDVGVSANHECKTFPLVPVVSDVTVTGSGGASKIIDNCAHDAPPGFPKPVGSGNTGGYPSHLHTCQFTPPPPGSVQRYDITIWDVAWEGDPGTMCIPPFLDVSPHVAAPGEPPPSAQDPAGDFRLDVDPHPPVQPAGDSSGAPAPVDSGPAPKQPWIPRRPDEMSTMPSRSAEGARASNPKRRTHPPKAA